MKNIVAKSGAGIAAAVFLIIGAVRPVHADELRSHRPADGMFNGHPIPYWNEDMSDTRHESVKLKNFQAGKFYIKHIRHLWDPYSVLVYMHEVYEKQVGDKTITVGCYEYPEYGEPIIYLDDLSKSWFYEIPEPKN